MAEHTNGKPVQPSWGSNVVAGDTNKLNGLFDIADIAEKMTAARDDNEPSLKKQRQDYNLALSVNSFNSFPLPDFCGHEEVKAITSKGKANSYEGNLTNTSEPVNTSTKSSPPSDRLANQQEQLLPPEFKQQLQLPLRKRHLLASSAVISSDQTDSPVLASPLLEVDVVSNADEAKPTSPYGSPLISAAPPKNNPFEKQLIDLYLPPRRAKKNSSNHTINNTITHSNNGDSNNSNASHNSDRSIVGHTNQRANGRGKGAGRGKKDKVSNRTGGGELYCLCVQPYRSGEFMIGCDTCNEWYHGSCVGITQKESKKIGTYVCPKCKPATDSSSSSSGSGSGSGSGTAPPTKAEPTQRGKKRSTNESPSEESIKRTRAESTGTKRSASQAGPKGVTPPDRKCGYQPCNNVAKPGSKYCSDPCSMSVAREAVKKKQGEERENSISVADVADMGLLDDIARRKAEIEEKLRRLEREQQELEKVIHSAAKRNGSSKEGVSPPTSPNISTTTIASPNLAVDSPKVPQSVSPLTSPSPPLPTGGVISPTNHEHTESHQKESNGYSGLVGTENVTCDSHDLKTKAKAHVTQRKKNSKKQPDEVCGCPTTDSPTGYCEMFRKNCVKHVNWEDIKRAALENEKAQHKNTLSTLDTEETRLRSRMARRKECANDPNRTIIEA